MNYDFIKLTVGVLATIGLYSALYKETKLYRFFEHIFLGLAAGFTLVAVWTETLKPMWWDQMVGRTADGSEESVPGLWLFAILVPIGLLGYTVFSRKHNWMSRIPIGIILGLWAGQQVQVWWTRYGPQMSDSMVPIIPTTSQFRVPPTDGLPTEQIQAIASQLYVSQALSNIVLVFTVLSVLSYFFFSFELKSRLVKGVNLSGRWLLMIGFGAIFGSTVMGRFALVIDRMFFIWIEWFKEGILRIPG